LGAINVDSAQAPTRSLLMVRGQSAASRIE